MVERLATKIFCVFHQFHEQLDVVFDVLQELNVTLINVIFLKFVAWKWESDSVDLKVSVRECLLQPVVAVSENNVQI